MFNKVVEFQRSFLLFTLNMFELHNVHNVHGTLYALLENLKDNILKRNIISK